MTQLRIGAARVCVRAGTYARFSRGVRGEKGMRGAGRARRGVYEGVVRVFFGARRLEDQTRHPAKRGFQERSSMYVSTLFSHEVMS